jgi:hypothetical protein
MAESHNVIRKVRGLDKLTHQELQERLRYCTRRMMEDTRTSICIDTDPDFQELTALHNEERWRMEFA